MNYQEQLNPWVVHQLSSNMTCAIAARFRRRTEAESYMKAMKQMRPNTEFAIAFETNPPAIAPVVAPAEPAKAKKQRSKAASKKSIA